MKKIDRKEIMEQKIYDEKKDNTNFDYLLKIVNLTNEPLLHQENWFKYGRVGGNKEYIFRDIPPNNYQKVKIWKTNIEGFFVGFKKYHLLSLKHIVKKSEVAVEGHVLFNLNNSSFDIILSNPLKGINQIKILDQFKHYMEEKKCEDKDNDGKTYCKINHDSCFSEIMKEKNSNGEKTCFIEKLINYSNLPSPYIIRYVVTNKKAVGVVIIDYA